MSAYIGYNNILETGTVTATSEQTGFEHQNAYDWLPRDWWLASSAGTVYLTVDMGANAVVDYWALAFHDLYLNSGTIKAQYSSDNFAADINDLDTVQTPTDGSPIMRVVTQRNVRYYRFEIGSTGSPSNIGMLALGQVLALPRDIPPAFTSPKHGRNKVILNSESEGGYFIGRSVQRMGQKFTITQQNVEQAWIDSNWETLIDHIEAKPFFFLWDQANRPTEAVFAWTDKGIKYPDYNPSLQSFTIPCKGNV